MKQSRRVSARTTLGSIRLASLGFGLTATVTEFLLLDRALPVGLMALSVVGGLLIVATLVITYVRGALITPFDSLGLALCAILVGIGLKDPFAIAGVGFAVVVAQSLYGNLASAVLRVACFVPVLPLTLFLAPTAAEVVPWSTPQAFSIGPALILFCGLMRSLKSSLERLTETTLRENLTASVSSHLLGCSDISQVTQVMKVAVADLCRITDGMRVVSISTERGVDGRITSARTAFVLGQPGAPTDRELPIDFLAPTERAKPMTFPVLPGGTRALAAAGLPKLVWFAQWVDIDTTRANGVDVILYGLPGSWWQRLPLIGGGPRTDWIESVRMFASQTAMAEATTRMYAALADRAQHDDLTGAANRSVLFEQLDRAFEESRGAEHEVALMLIDLDDFKHVNDSRGHEAADALLVELSRRIQEAVGDRGLPARFGGDEFAVLLPRVTGVEETRAIAQRVMRRLTEPVQLVDGAIVLAASIGAAVTQDGDAHEPGIGSVAGKDLLRCADVALYSAKSAGKARIEVYAAEKHGELARSRRLEEQLPRALADGEIAVHFQPVVDLFTGRPLGLEALARWQHPDDGVLEAAEFVHLADRSGQGAALGAHLVRSAVRTMQGWQRLPGLDRLWLSVNVSARQVSDPRFLDSLLATLAETGLPPERLVLEIPERGLLGGSELRGRLAAVAATGVRIALDDFAAEHASLAHLEAIPVKQLKIDRKQLLELDPARAETMLAMIMAVSRFLDLETVAEAVESEEHARWARAAGIALAEGYLFAEPMAPELVSAWLERSVHLRTGAAGPVDVGLEAV